MQPRRAVPGPPLGTVTSQLPPPRVTQAPQGTAHPLYGRGLGTGHTIPSGQPSLSPYTFAASVVTWRDAPLEEKAPAPTATPPTWQAFTQLSRARLRGAPLQGRGGQELDQSADSDNRKGGAL